MHDLQVKELLLPFGSLKAFNLVMDKNTGNSKVNAQKLMSSALPGSEASLACFWVLPLQSSSQESYMHHVISAHNLRRM